MEENKIIKINELAQKILDEKIYEKKIDILRILFKKYIKKQNKKQKCRDKAHKEFFRELGEKERRSKIHWDKFYDMSH